MNPLDIIKEKMRLKPTEQEQKIQEVQVVIPVPSLRQTVTVQNVQFKDEQEPDFPIDAILKGLAERKIGKVSTKTTIQLKPVSEKEISEVPVKKPKRISKKVLLVLREEGVDIVPSTRENEEEKARGENGEPIKKRAKKRPAPNTQQ